MPVTKYRHITRLYCYGFNADGASWVLFRSLQEIADEEGLPTVNSRSVHRDGVNIVYAKLTKPFMELCEGFEVDPTNVILMPADPNDAEWDYPGFNGIFARRCLSPDDPSFRRHLAAISRKLAKKE